DSKTLWATADDDARHRLFRIDLATDSVRALTQEQSVTGVVLGPNGPVGIRHGLQQPPEVFELSPDGGLRTMPVFPGGQGFTGTIEEMRVPGAGGAPVHSWLVLPQGEGPFPTLIWIHGGPFSAWRDEWRWHWNVQIAVAAGFAVVLPNPRG